MSTIKYSPRLADKYKKDVVPALMKRFNYDSVMQVPRLEKICLNRGVNGAVTDKKLVDVAQSIGYESDAAFSKAFKRVVGLTPGEYRRNSLARQEQATA